MTRPRASATENLLKDHRLIRKILESFRADHPRFPDLLATLRRTVLGHAWFEDEFLLPALQARPGVFQPFRREIGQEHEDIAGLLRYLSTVSPDDRGDGVKTLHSLLQTHFAKEEEVLFPLADKIIGEEGLGEMAGEMERRKSEVRKFIPG